MSGTTFDHRQPLLESSRDIKGKCKVGVSLERLTRGYKQRFESNSPLLSISLSTTTTMSSNDTRSINAPASDAETIPNNTRNDGTVYMHLRTKYDVRATKPPDFPAEMSVFATPSATQRIINVTNGTGAAISALAHAIQDRNCVSPIKSSLSHTAKGNTKKYQWEEWEEQTRKKWKDSIDDHNFRYGGETGLKMVSIDEPSKAWQKELGVSLVPMSEVYKVVEGERGRAEGWGRIIRGDTVRHVHVETPSVSLAGFEREIAGPSLMLEDFIPTPSVPDDDASRLT